MDLTRFYVLFASNQWISCVARFTQTFWCVANNITYAIYTTTTRARVATFPIQTSSVSGTVTVLYTFWSTACVRISEEIGQAFTSAYRVMCSAHCIGSTGTWVTRLLRNLGNSDYNCIFTCVDKCKFNRLCTMSVTLDDELQRNTRSQP